MTECRNEQTLVLPWPPTVNHYYRNVHGRTLISRKGREYRLAVAEILRCTRAHKLDGRLEVCIQAFPPDRRKRDLDNIGKAVLDALQHGGAFEDDSQIDRLILIRREAVESGRLAVTIHSIAHERHNDGQERIDAHAARRSD